MSNKYKNIPSSNEVDLDDYHSIEDDTTEEIPPKDYSSEPTLKEIPDWCVEDILPLTP